MNKEGLFESKVHSIIEILLSMAGDLISDLR